MTKANPIVVEPWKPGPQYRTETKDGDTPIALQTPSPSPITLTPEQIEQIGGVKPHVPSPYAPSPAPVLVQPPISSPPITSDPLPSIPLPSTPSTTTLKPTPAPQFKETDEGVVITNLAEIKASNRQYNDAVDALAPYKQGNNYDISKLVRANDSKAESAAKLLLGVSSTDISKIKSGIREYEALQKEGLGAARAIPSNT